MGGKNANFYVNIELLSEKYKKSSKKKGNCKL